MIDRLYLLELRGKIQNEYIASLESANYTRTSFLRGELAIISQLLKEVDI
jgi:hypothetical protein